MSHETSNAGVWIAIIVVVVLLVAALVGGGALFVVQRRAVVQHQVVADREAARAEAMMAREAARMEGLAMPSASEAGGASTLHLHRSGTELLIREGKSGAWVWVEEAAGGRPTKLLFGFGHGTNPPALGHDELRAEKGSTTCVIERTGDWRLRVVDPPRVVEPTVTAPAPVFEGLVERVLDVGTSLESELLRLTGHASIADLMKIGQ